MPDSPVLPPPPVAGVILVSVAVTLLVLVSMAEVLVVPVVELAAGR
jgi:hypothetical protein